MSEPRLPRPPRRIPFVGDVFAIDRDRPSQSQAELAVRLGEIYELKFGSYRFPVVTGTELAQQVWDEARFKKYVPPPMRRMRDITGGDPFVASASEEQMWARSSRIMTPGFTKDAMRIYHSAMVEAVEALFAHWNSRADARVDLTADLNALTFELIGRAGFSTTFDAFDHAPRPHPFVAQLNRATSWMSTIAATPGPLRGRLERRHGGQYREDIAAVSAFGAQLVAQRSADPRPSPPDLLDLMLTTADPQTGAGLSSDDITFQTVSLLLAGQGTTAGTLAFAMHYVMSDPALLEALRAEVGEVCPDGPIRYEQVAKLRLARRVIDETLRLWPVAPGHFRSARYDQTIGGGWAVRTGQPVFVLTLGLHRNPDWGPDATSFDPDGFLPAGTKGPYRPFGVGPRACLGRQFALHEMVLALAMMVHRYDYAPDGDYVLTVSEQLSLRPRDLYATVTPRPNSTPR